MILMKANGNVRNRNPRKSPPIGNETESEKKQEKELRCQIFQKKKEKFLNVRTPLWSMNHTLVRICIISVINYFFHFVNL